MPAIRFLSDQIFESEGHNKGPRFAAGSTLDLADVGKAIGQKVTTEYAAGFLDRWVRRNVAVYVGAEEQTKAVEPKTPAFGTAKHGRGVAGLDDGKQVPVAPAQRAKLEQDSD